MNPSPVLDIKAFVPAKDFDLSKQFYADLGFTINWSGDGVAELQIGSFRFLLRVLYLSDPTGALWHIADSRKA